MKKFLSLVLALVMTMSLVTVSAGAKDDYNDASKITYKEAVAVMSELGVIDGYTNGDFGPTATLTRGAAAKIICNLILGPTTAAALKADTAPFIDVSADNVFAGYIAYCAQRGIINGYADGTFRPSAGLTGYAFMKMLLGALGYDGDIEGYVGSNWSIAVAKQAIAIGLDDGNDNFNGTAIVTREEALLYAFNTLKATMVDYSSKVEVNNGNGSTVTISGGRYDVSNSENDDYRTNGDDQDEYMQFCEKYFSKLTLTESEDDFGRLTNKWKYNKKDIGSFVKTPDAFYTVDTKEKVIYADLDLDETYEFDVIVDGIDNGETFQVHKKNCTGSGAIDSVADATNELVGNGSQIYVYLNEDATDGRIVVINTFLAKVSDDYDDKNDTLDIETVETDGKIAGVRYSSDWAGATLSDDDFDNLDTFAEDDYVMITLADGEVKSIVKAEPVTAAVTEYVHTESVTAGGEEYAYSVVSEHKSEDGETFSYELKSNYDLYLDNYGYVMFADGEEAEDKYVYIDEFSADSNSSRAAADAYAYFTDGTEAEIKVSHINGTKVTAADVDEVNQINNNGAGWYTYTIKNDKYKLDSIADQYGEDVASETEVVNYKSNHTEITDSVNTKDGTSKTKFIIVDDDTVKAYTGIKNVPSITAGTDTYVAIQYDGSYAAYVFIDLGNGTIKGANLSSDIIFTLKLDKQGNDADDDEYYRYKALKNGEETTVRFDKDVVGNNAKAGKLYMDVEYTSKNYVTSATEVDGAVASKRDDTSRDIIKFSDASDFMQKGNTLILGNQPNSDYFLADSYKIFVISGDEFDTYTAKGLVRAITKGDVELTTNSSIVYGILNDANEYTALYIVE